MPNSPGETFQPFIEDPYPFYAWFRQEEPITWKVLAHRQRYASDAEHTA